MIITGTLEPTREALRITAEAVTGTKVTPGSAGQLVPSTSM